MSSGEKRRRRMYQQAIKHPDVAAKSFSYHTKRLITRPFRILLTILVVYAFVMALVVFTTDMAAAQQLLQDGITVGGIQSVLPPLIVVVGLAVATLVVVPVGYVMRGLRRDLRTNRSRERRMNDK